MTVSNPLGALTAVLLVTLAGCKIPGPEPCRSARPLPPHSLPGDGVWRPLFAADTLAGWETIRFGGEGEVELRDGILVLSAGEPFTGIRWTNEVPTMNYEVELEACRLLGGDFFCGLTVPVGASHCTLILGGWGGGVVGLSSLDGLDASENETTSYRAFDNDRWYRLRLRVVDGRIQAWLDGDPLVDVSTVDRQVGLRPGMIGLSRPLGICSWATTAGIRNVRLRGVISDP